MDADRASARLQSSPSRREKRESLPGIGKNDSPKGQGPGVNQSIDSSESFKGKRVPRESSAGQQQQLLSGKALDTLAAQTFKRHDRYNQGNLERDATMTALGEIAAPFGLNAKEALELDSERCKLKRFSLADFVNICSRLSMQHVQRLRDERIKNTGAIKTQVPPGADVNPNLMLVFDSYSSYTAGIAKPNDPIDGGIGILTQQLNKLCLDIGLLSSEGGPLNVSEMDIAFARVKAPNSRRITYPQWLVLLCILTDKSGWDLFKTMEDHAEKLGQKAGIPPPSFIFADADRKKMLPPLEEGSFGPASVSSRTGLDKKSEGGALGEVTGPPSSALKPISDYRPPLKAESSTSDPLWMTQVLDRLSRLEAARGSIPAEGSDLGRLLGALERGVEYSNQAVGQWSADGPSLSQEITEMRIQMAELKTSNVAKAKEMDKLVIKVKELEANQGKHQAPGADTAALEARIAALEQLSQKQAARLKELQATNLTSQPSPPLPVPPKQEASAPLEPRLAALELQVIALEKRSKKGSKEQENAESSIAEQIVSHHEHIQAHASRLEEMAQLLSLTQDSVQEHSNLIHEIESKVNLVSDSAASAERLLTKSHPVASAATLPVVDVETKIEMREMQSKIQLFEDKILSKISPLELLSDRHKDLYHKVGQIEKQCMQMDKQQMILQQQYHAVAAQAAQRPMTGVVDGDQSDSRLRKTTEHISQLSSRISEVEAKSRANVEALLISHGLMGLSEKFEKRILVLESARQDNEVLADEVSKIKQKQKQKIELIEGEIEAIKERMGAIAKSTSAAAAAAVGSDAADSVTSKKVLSELKNLRDEVGKLSEDVNIKLTTRLNSTTNMASEAVASSAQALANSSKALDKAEKVSSAPQAPVVEPVAIKELSDKIKELQSEVESLKSQSVAALRAPSATGGPTLDRSKNSMGGGANSAMIEEAAKRSSQAAQSVSSLRTEVDALAKGHDQIKVQLSQLMSISAVTSTQLGTTQQHVQSVTNLAENIGKELAELKAGGGMASLGLSVQRHSNSGAVSLPPNRSSFNGADTQDLSRLSGTLPPGLLEFIEQDHNVLVIMQSDIQQLAVAIGEVAGRFVAVEKDIGEALASYVKADDLKGVEIQLLDRLDHAHGEIDQIKFKVMDALSMRPMDYNPGPSRDGLASGGGDSLGPLPTREASIVNKNLAPSAKVSMRYQNWLDQKSTSSNGRLRTPVLRDSLSDSGQSSRGPPVGGGGGGGGGRTRFGQDSSRAETLVIDEASSFTSMTPEGSQVFSSSVQPAAPKLPRLTTPDHDGNRSSQNRARFSDVGGGSIGGGGGLSGGGAPGQEKILALEGQIKRVHDTATEKLELHTQAIMHMAKQIDVLQETIKSPQFNSNPPATASSSRTVKISQSMNSH